MTAAVDSLIARLSEAERRLAEHASRPLPPGLSEPDPGGEERWEAGQVWAHLAEFPAYWLAQAQRVIALPTNEPVPFGRVKTDAARIAAIERDRNTDPEALLHPRPRLAGGSHRCRPSAPAGGMECVAESIRPAAR